MYTFIISLIALVLGYFLYGKLVDKVFKPDAKRVTPAITKADGVDYVAMPGWKMFMIQFLNIAGLGPIFGAIMGAKFGASAYLWIVFGCIFAGAVHDYISGMLSLRHDGESLPELTGRYLGNGMKQFSRVFIIILMILTGVVFVSGPAGLLQNLTHWPIELWMVIIFAYYVLAAMLPIDKLIGRIYPLFSAALLFMVLGLMIYIFVKQPPLPELTDGLQNLHPAAETHPIFPMLFISIACGAISGFHATQSPLMARCMTNEKQGRPIFYGAMITEGVVALVWAAAANVFYAKNGMDVSNAAVVVNTISTVWLGRVGGVLAILGVVFAPISSGDTAFRSARLIAADMLHYDQGPVKKRLVIVLPMFLAAILILLYSFNDKEGFDIVWRYFAWANQTLATITLWAITVWMFRHRIQWHWMTFLPAVFMTFVVVTYILVAPEGFRVNYNVSLCIAAAIDITFIALFYVREIRKRKLEPELVQE